METRAMIPPHVFAAIDSLNIAELSALREDELRPLLPSLVRMSLCSPLDQGMFVFGKALIASLRLGIPR